MNAIKPYYSETYTNLINYNSEEESEHETEYTTNTTEYSSPETTIQTTFSNNCCCKIL
jgi:hypothetical protein